jgi:hypothetical protein
VGFDFHDNRVLAGVRLIVGIFGRSNLPCGSRFAEFQVRDL